MILRLRLISIFIGILYLSVTISSNTSSSNNQAYASLNNEINESIKKACPTYEGNGGIDGLVSDILKACLGHSNQPPTTPNPEIQQSFQRIF
ncbi:hypothetical protein NMY3_03676 [Candidatus Nitrosocosmicus oleophilus]|uniref:Uncharacterized protein n=1 Tax=Candidatus Nitrosocosmicus oleophilus TaxID=1353260 RepID=A0A654M285_9ARCH|nr:hypothetical protein NMY3_03676 [Candidatus Nitrosocosmicus oleophilus]